MSNLPTGPVTFLFTDIAGSTRILRDVGNVIFAGALASHHALVRTAVAEAGGIEFGTEGDAFFLVFENTRTAVAAAVAAQRALAAHVWPAGAEISVRMGIHEGVGVLSDGDYVGMDVHHVARVASAGHGGQVLLSATAAAGLAGSTPDDVELEDLGDHRLKDLGPQRLFQLRITGLAGDFPPLSTQEAVVVELPAQLTTFVGRDSEVEAVLERLEIDRLVTLTGPGGTGKSRLAVEVASRASEDFDDGVYFVSLSGLSDAELVAVSILEALGLRSNSAAVEPLEHLVSFLKERQLLLVLDNFEQLIDAATVVSTIVAASPRLRIVITSRTPLRISGEAEVAVLPLGTSRSEDGEPSEGARLFVDRARSIRPELQMTDEDTTAIEQIVTRLDGLPLAIELAASRANVLTPVEILDRLGNKLLASTSGDRPSRQRTIAAAIGWSYDLLDAPTQRLFQRCSVFVSGAGLTEIEAVCADDDVPIDDILDGLGALVDHNLMVRRETAHGLRFAMLIVIREFAAERLDEAGRSGRLRDRHRSVYGAMIEHARPLLVTSARPTWLDRIAADHDNVRAALEHAISQGDVASAYSFLAGMWRFLQTRGPLAEAREWARQVLAMEHHDEHPELRVRALLASGGIAYWSGVLDQMEAPYREALEIARRLGDDLELASALYEFSFVFSSRGDYDEAIELLDESMSLARAMGDTYAIGRAEFGLFNAAWYSSRTEPALRHARAAVAALSQVDAPYDLGWSEFSVADSLMRLGETEEATELLDRAMPRFVAAGDLSALILFLATYAALASLDGNKERAARLAGAAESIQEQTGARLYASAAWRARNEAVQELIGELDGDVEYEYQAGRSMGPQAAAAYALSKSST